MVLFNRLGKKWGEIISLHRRKKKRKNKVLLYSNVYYYIHTIHNIH